MFQKSYSRLWQGFANDTEARQARDNEYRRLKNLGIKSRRWVLKNQTKQYDGLGQPNGSVCDVYMLNIIDREKYAAIGV